MVEAGGPVSAKVEISAGAQAAGVPVSGAMGAGNKLDPELFRVDYIENTSICPLARVMRKEMKKRGLRRVKVVYSTEMPAKPSPVPCEPQEPCSERPGKRKLNPPGSISCVPEAAGLVLSGAVVRGVLAKGGESAWVGAKGVALGR